MANESDTTYKIALRPDSIGEMLALRLEVVDSKAQIKRVIAIIKRIEAQLEGRSYNVCWESGFLLGICLVRAAIAGVTMRNSGLE